MEIQHHIVYVRDNGCIKLPQEVVELLNAQSGHPLQIAVENNIVSLWPCNEAGAVACDLENIADEIRDLAIAPDRKRAAINHLKDARGILLTSPLA